ncbi:tetratricopeptide repeat protein [Candidatus Njordibacter sp. Uisw_058]|jgi:hypothetical protein|uniref:tetratricopeptide repeat protein n=1 Tax=Candidatus Njordibacter sp. Uisw_058 TaxID=3230974 RepID=UPI003D528D12
MCQFRLITLLLWTIFSPQLLAQLNFDLALGCLDEWVINGKKYQTSDILASKKHNKKNINWCVDQERVDNINEIYIRVANGDIDAKRELADAHSNGRAIPRNEKIEIGLWLDIAESYPGEKEYLLASKVYMCDYVFMLRQKGADNANGDECFYWAEAAAKLGHKFSMNMLANHYLLGVGTMKNYKESFYWFNEAALGGDTSSMYSLIFSYIRGEGVPINYSEAYSWALVFDYHAKQYTRDIYKESYNQIIEGLEGVLNSNDKMKAQERSIKISQLIEK